MSTPCVWPPLIPRYVEAFRKRKTHLMGTIAQVFDAPLKSYDSLMSTVPCFEKMHY